MKTANSFSRKAPKILFYGFAFFTIARAADYLFYGFHLMDLASTISFALLAYGNFRSSQADGQTDRLTLATLILGLVIGAGEVLARHLT